MKISLFQREKLADHISEKNSSVVFNEENF